jgi:hypothetical protein
MGSNIMRCFPVIDIANYLSGIARTFRTVLPSSKPKIASVEIEASLNFHGAELTYHLHNKGAEKSAKASENW